MSRGTRRLLACGTAVGWLGMAGCTAPHEAGVLDVIAEAPASTDPSGGTTSLASLGPTRYVKAEPASPTAEFFVLAREGRQKKAPCASCHAVPLAQLAKTTPVRAHWTLDLQHATDRVMTCRTCHAAEAPAALSTLNGHRVSFDHGYQVCAQCHSRQAADWAGGAHGKRAGGWAPPRVVYNCAECHDPHRPKLATRWPARAGSAQ